MHNSLGFEDCRSATHLLNLFPADTDISSARACRCHTIQLALYLSPGMVSFLAGHVVQRPRQEMPSRQQEDISGRT